jgi:hypothetical protein
VGSTWLLVARVGKVGVEVGRLPSWWGFELVLGPGLMLDCEGPCVSPFAVSRAWELGVSWPACSLAMPPLTG